MYINISGSVSLIILLLKLVSKSMQLERTSFKLNVVGIIHTLQE